MVALRRISGLSAVALVFSLVSCATFDGLTLNAAGAGLPMVIAASEFSSAHDLLNGEKAREAGMYNIMYANAFVAGRADYLPVDRFDNKKLAKQEALTLYLRGKSYELKALDLRYPGFESAWKETGIASFGHWLEKMSKADVAAMYWLVASQLGSYSLQPMNLELGADLNKSLALLRRAYELDPDFQKSALDELLLTVNASIPESLGGDPTQAQGNFDRALEKTNGNSAGAYLAWATAIDVQTQNRDHFVEMMNKVLAIDPSRDPDNKLPLLLSQERARWYLSRVDDLFI